jgi:hypothetical protein
MYVVVGKQRTLKLSSGYRIFQMMFANVTEEHLVLNVKRTYIYRIIVISIMMISMIPVKSLQPHLHYWHILCCSVCFCVVSIAITTFSGVFRSLGKAAIILNTCFKVREKCVLMYSRLSIIRGNGGENWRG